MLPTSPVTPRPQILGNIAANPTEDKYRKLRTSNNKIAQLLATSGVRALLRGAGFEEHGEFLVLSLDTPVDGVQTAFAEMETLAASRAQAADAAKREVIESRKTSNEVGNEQRKVMRMQAMRCPFAIGVPTMPTFACCSKSPPPPLTPNNPHHDQLCTSPLTTHYSLLTTHCILLTTHYSLHTAHRSLLTAYCLLAQHLIRPSRSRLTSMSSPCHRLRTMRRHEKSQDGQLRRLASRGARRSLAAQILEPLGRMDDVRAIRATAQATAWP